jgi:RNA polymerase sigma-70 factor (ECF subfamily)
MRADQTGDAELMVRVQHGEEAALRQVYDLYAARLFRILKVLLGDHHQAEDVLQQVFLQAWRTAASYDPQRAPLAAWLTQIARSRALDALRRRPPEVHLTASVTVQHPPEGERLDLANALHRIRRLPRSRRSH